MEGLGRRTLLLALALSSSICVIHAGLMDCTKVLEPWIWATSAPVVVDSDQGLQPFLLPPRAQGADYFGPGHLPDISLHLYEGRLNISQPFTALFVNGGSGERTLMLATQLQQLQVPYRILHIDESRTLNQQARSLISSWSHVHDTALHIDVLDTSLTGLCSMGGTRLPDHYDYIDYSAMRSPGRASVEAELGMVRGLLRPGEGGVGVTLAGGFAAGRRSLDAIRSLLQQSGGLPRSFDDWPDAIDRALKQACRFPRGMKLQSAVLHTLAVQLRGVATFQSWEVRPLLQGAGLEFVAPASPALYPEEDGSWGLGGAAAAGLGAGSSDDCMRFTDADALQRDPWSFEYAVHEVYGRRRRPAEEEEKGGGGLGSWEMWHHPHDLLIMPRTLSRLQQLKEKWAAGNRSLTVTFGPLAPPLTISADPRVGAALLEAVGPQVVELSQALHGTLDVLRKSGSAVTDFAGFDRAFRGILATLLGLGWVSILDGRFLDAGRPPEAAAAASPNTTDADRSSRAVQGDSEQIAGPEDDPSGSEREAVAAVEKSRDEEEEGSLLQLGQGLPLVVVLYNRRTVLEETAKGLAGMLGSLGVPVLLQTDEQEPHDPDALHIVLGPNFLSWLPRRFVLYQLENLRTWLRKSPHYLTVARQALAVWEFSLSQMDYWAGQGVQAVWVPVFVTIPSLPPSGAAEDEQQQQEDIDVLFYGSWSRRRAAVKDLLEAWAARTGRVVWFQLDYEAMGARRAELLSRAKVVLNLHSLESRVLEVHRINTLLATGKCVVSEPSSDAALDALYKDAVVFADLSNLEEQLEQLLDNPATRRGLQQAGQVVLAGILKNRQTARAVLESLSAVSDKQQQQQQQQQEEETATF